MAKTKTKSESTATAKDEIIREGKKYKLVPISRFINQKDFNILDAKFVELKRSFDALSEENKGLKQNVKAGEYVIEDLDAVIKVKNQKIREMELKMDKQFNRLFAWAMLASIAASYMAIKLF